MKVLNIITKTKALLLMCLCLVSFNSHAILLGDEMTATWSYDRTGYFDTNTFVASDGLDLAGDFGPMNLDVTATSIIVDNTYGGGYANGVSWQFFGIDLSDGGSISDVHVNTNYRGWSDSFLTFSDDSITVNFLKMVRWDFSSDIFELTVLSSATPVSEPGSLALLGLGLIGIGFFRRKKL